MRFLITLIAVILILFTSIQYERGNITADTAWVSSIIVILWHSIWFIEPR